MHLIDAAALREATPYPALISALESGLRHPIRSPSRSSHTFDEQGSVLLTMPAWSSDARLLGVKLLTVCPKNGEKGLPSINGIYVAFDRADGGVLACIDGASLTARRTAATSALAAKHLSRRDSRVLLVVGTGAVARELIPAHAAIHPYHRVLLWGRSRAKAEAIASDCAGAAVSVEVALDLEAAVREADVVASATAAEGPFIDRAWVAPGTHLSMMGAFTPAMAECDPELISSVRVFADTRIGVIEKGGEVCQAIQKGIVREQAIEAELAELATGTFQFTRDRGDVTLFKSVGFAALDLIAAQLAIQTRPAHVR
jgi:alanine dehydrogenase